VNHAIILKHSPIFITPVNIPHHQYSITSISFLFSIRLSNFRLHYKMEGINASQNHKYIYCCIISLSFLLYYILLLSKCTPISIQEILSKLRMGLKQSPSKSIQRSADKHRPIFRIATIRSTLCVNVGNIKAKHPYILLELLVRHNPSPLRAYQGRILLYSVFF